MHGLSLMFILVNNNSCVNRERHSLNVKIYHHAGTLFGRKQWNLCGNTKTNICLSPTACLSICVSCYSFFSWYRHDHMTHQSIFRNQTFVLLSQFLHASNVKRMRSGFIPKHWEGGGITKLSGLEKQKSRPDWDRGLHIYMKFVPSSRTLHKTYERKHFRSFDPCCFTEISVCLLSIKHIKNRDKVLSITAALSIRLYMPSKNYVKEHEKKFHGLTVTLTLLCACSTQDV